MQHAIEPTGTDDMREFVLALVDTVQRARRQHSSVDSVERGAVGRAPGGRGAGERGHAVGQGLREDLPTGGGDVDESGAGIGRIGAARDAASVVERPQVAADGGCVEAGVLGEFRASDLAGLRQLGEHADRATLARLMRRLSNELENL